MIVKRIPARPPVRNVIHARATHARLLVDYLRLPEKANAYREYLVDYMLSEKLADQPLERLFHVGGRGFVSNAIEGQRAEMIAVAQAASRSPNPVDHWLLSWREGEFPEFHQVDEVVAMFVEHLGVAQQPCIYACHGDTMNRHVHIALNRYDAVRGRMIEINGGFTLEAAHQAVALIVDRFKWQPESNARYCIVDGQLSLTDSVDKRKKAGEKPLRPDAAAFENRTGYASAQRIAQAEAMPLINEARSWAEAHQALATKGIRYEKVGTNGAFFVVGDQRVRASFVHRDMTRNALEKRFAAPFEQRHPAIEVISREHDQDRLLEAFRADEYRRWRENWHERKKSKKALRAYHPLSDKANSVSEAANPQNVLMRPPPDLESWYYDQNEREFAKRWRHRLKPKSKPQLELTGRPANRESSSDGFGGYLPFPCSAGTRYARDGEGTAFIDARDRVSIVLTDDAALLAALKLAKDKFGAQILVKGPPELRNKIYRIALENGLADAIDSAEFAAKYAAKGRAAAKTVISNANGPSASAPPGDLPSASSPQSSSTQLRTNNLFQQVAELARQKSGADRKPQEQFVSTAKGPKGFDQLPGPATVPAKRSLSPEELARFSNGPAIPSAPTQNSQKDRGR